MRRVVVTGMGVISPVGNDLESFWNNLTEGKNGVGMITRFDTTEQKVKVAAEVKDFEPTKYIEKSQVRKTDLFAQYALAAAVQAMEDAGLKSGENIDAERLGVYVGSGTGGINTITEQCNKFAQSGPKHISPFLVPMMIGNNRKRQHRNPFRCTGTKFFQLLPHVQLPPMRSEKPSMQSVMDMLMPSSPAVQKLQSMRLLSQVLQTAKH